MRKVELEGLLNALVPHAERQLAEYGDFYPFAGVMRTDGALESVAPDPEAVTSSLDQWQEDLLEKLRAGASAGFFRATGLVLNVEVDVPGSERARAIRVALEHETGVSYDVFIPYWFESGELGMGSAMTAEGACEVFNFCVEPEAVPLAAGG